MINLKKAYNFKVMLLLSLTFFNSLFVYGLDLSEKSYLRIPMMANSREGKYRQKGAATLLSNSTFVTNKAKTVGKEMNSLFKEAHRRLLESGDTEHPVEFLASGDIASKIYYKAYNGNSSIDLDVEIKGGLVTNRYGGEERYGEKIIIGLFWGFDKNGQLLIIDGEYVHQHPYAPEIRGKTLIRYMLSQVHWDKITEDIRLFEMRRRGFNEEAVNLIEREFRSERLTDKPMFLSYELEGGIKNLGTKGFWFRVFTALNILYPTGFLLPAQMVSKIRVSGKVDTALEKEIDKLLERIGDEEGKKRSRWYDEELRFGKRRNPLLLSVRASPESSMPGMLPTIINIGINDEIAEFLSNKTYNFGSLQYWDEKAVFSAYSRLIETYSTTIFGVKQDVFEGVLNLYLKERKIGDAMELKGADYKELVKRYKEKLVEFGFEFPQDVRTQLSNSIIAVAKNWDSPTAERYRRMNLTPDDSGMAIIVQGMALGHIGENSGSGVIYSRNPDTGENNIAGSFEYGSQGVDIVSGRIKASDISVLSKRNPEIYNRLKKIAGFLEFVNRKPVEIEFTIESDKLNVLQCREARISPVAELRFYKEISEEGFAVSFDFVGALAKFKDYISHRKIYRVKDGIEKRILAKGGFSTYGAVRGRIVLSPEKVREFSIKGDPVIIIIDSLTSGQRDQMLQLIFKLKNVALLTSYGNQGSHEVVLTRLAGVPAIVGVAEMKIEGSKVNFDESSLDEGAWGIVDADNNEIITTKSEDVLIETDPSIDVSYGIDFYEEKRIALEPYVTKENLPKKRVNYKTVFEANLSLLSKYIDMEEEVKKGLHNIELKKELFVINLRKHFLHELLIELGAKEGKEREEIDYALQLFVSESLVRKVIERSEAAGETVIWHSTLTYQYESDRDYRKIEKERYKAKSMAKHIEGAEFREVEEHFMAHPNDGAHEGRHYIFTVVLQSKIKYRTSLGGIKDNIESLSNQL